MTPPRPTELAHFLLSDIIRKGDSRPMILSDSGRFAEPELLLRDEPFAGLDPLVREEVLAGVIAALREGERTVLCATHELDVAARIADRIAVLHEGRIQRHDELSAVLGEDEPAQVPAGLQRVLAEVVL